MRKEYDLVVCIGRFQPFHAGHSALIEQALELSSHVLVLIGSSNRSRSPKNPFTYEERERLIAYHFKWNVSQGELFFSPLPDDPYLNDGWIINVQQGVKSFLELGYVNPQKELKVGLLGFKKDESSNYLDWFDNWDKIPATQESIFSATPMREQFISPAPLINTFLPEVTSDFLNGFVRTPHFSWLVDFKMSLQNEAKIWGNTPHPPVAKAADALIIYKDQVLLGRRGSHPGKGQLCLPGGHVMQKEWPVDAALRELDEETKLADNKGRVPKGLLKSWIRGEFDADLPDRSERPLRVYSKVFMIRLPNREGGYTFQGSDDMAADGLDFYDFGTLDPCEFFEDHYFLIKAGLAGQFKASTGY